MMVTTDLLVKITSTVDGRTGVNSRRREKARTLYFVTVLVGSLQHFRFYERGVREFEFSCDGQTKQAGRAKLRTL